MLPAASTGQQKANEFSKNRCQMTNCILWKWFDGSDNNEYKAKLWNWLYPLIIYDCILLIAITQEYWGTLLSSSLVECSKRYWPPLYLETDTLALCFQFFIGIASINKGCQVWLNETCLLIAVLHKCNMTVSVCNNLAQIWSYCFIYHCGVYDATEKWAITIVKITIPIKIFEWCGLQSFFKAFTVIKKRLLGI